MMITLREAQTVAITVRSAKKHICAYTIDEPAMASTIVATITWLPHVLLQKTDNSWK